MPSQSINVQCRRLAELSGFGVQLSFRALGRRGFTTLSTVLGKMIMCTHKGLLQALSSETSPAALTALLRFAAVLFGMTPYQRLPLTMLPGIMQVSTLSDATSCTCTDPALASARRTFPTPDQLIHHSDSSNASISHAQYLH